MSIVIPGGGVSAMALASSSYRTLGELRAILLARLGMGGMGASGGANQALMDSFLSNGQSQLYWLADWKHITTYYEFTTGIGQNLYDYPELAGRNRRLLRVEVRISNVWRELREGITTAMWSTMETQTIPQRYDRYSQVLLYPKPNQAYTMRMWYVADLGRFTQNDDRATLDDEMILLHAVTNAKAHYRQPDAKLYEGQLNALLAQIRGQSFGSNGVYQRSSTAMPEPKPMVVGRDV